jgi:hypothetical protein
LTTVQGRFAEVVRRDGRAALVTAFRDPLAGARMDFTGKLAGM